MDLRKNWRKRVDDATSLDLEEWDGQRISILREEDAWIDENGNVLYFASPQKELWVIGSSP